MTTRGFSFKGLVDYVLALKDSLLLKIDTLTATDVDAVPVEDAWKEPYKPLGNVDYNKLVENGNYYVNGSSQGAVNAPSGDGVFLKVVSRAGNWTYQDASSYYSSTGKYFRMFKNDSDAPAVWQEYYTTANKPTLRDIESEPNAKGETENLMDIISELRYGIAELKTKVK